MALIEIYNQCIGFLIFLLVSHSKAYLIKGFESLSKHRQAQASPDKKD
jgi:hypothetical protein